MIFLLGLVGVPIAYLVVLITLLVRRQPRGVALSVLLGAASVATGIWAITQSRSSTAGIGFLGIPLLGALGGFLGLAFGRYRPSDQPSRRLGAWAALAGALLLVAFNISQGLHAKAGNRVKDDKQAAYSAKIASDRESIAAGLKENPGRERAWLDSAIRARMKDDTFVFAALANDSVSPDLLDSLANSPGLGIALEAVRNRSTRAATLERVYRKKSYPDYFFQALAAHQNTPSNVMLELYHRPRTIMNLDIWFAGNPSSPKEILGDIARTATDRNVIGALLENPALDCSTLSQLAVNLMKQQNHDADNPSVMRLNERLPAVCHNTTQ
ncbi:MAG: hypothetical protein QOK07_193 [Gemmatimonadaceae bacterium]|jgi:hypothetical protein|nr:hypothetical protein [Gemmatimonadaceae bacterium]